MPTIKDYWTLDQIGGGATPLYVYLRPPGSPQSSIRFNLAGLPSEVRAGLTKIRHGDRVPEELIRALEALPGHESFRGSFVAGGDPTGDPTRVRRS
jgi:hypothetical protein